jgi:hypothetical protein
MTVRSPADLLAAVPFLLGFHPTESLVVIALRDKKIIFAARGDLPAATAPAGEVAAAGDYVAAVVAQQGGTAATVIGYGEPGRVDRVFPAVREALAACGVHLLEALRVESGRYWSFLCTNPRCCPPAGTPYDTSTSEVTAAATYAGQVILPDREAVARQVAPVGSLARESMRQATTRAEARLVDLLDAAGTGDVLGGRAVRQAGAAAVREAFARQAGRDRLTDDEVGWLTLLLAHVPVRDYAWERITDADWQIELWADVVRRAEPDLVPAPASLLAFAAWRIGHGALANVALDRALAEDPAYSMALLLREALHRGIPPEALASWPAVRAQRRGGGGLDSRRRSGQGKREKRRRSVRR